MFHSTMSLAKSWLYPDFVEVTCVIFAKIMMTHFDSAKVTVNPNMHAIQHTEFVLKIWILDVVQT